MTTKNIQNYSVRRGFTLIETLVAILILTIVIAAPITIAQKGLQSALVAKDQLTALYLAQDAVEGVYFLRDTDKLQGNVWSHWITMMTPCESPNLACYLGTEVYPPTTMAACANASCTDHPLYFNPANGIYNYNNANTLTIFSRAVTIVSPVGSNANEARVTVTVTWRDSSSQQTHSVNLTDDLLGWQ